MTVALALERYISVKYPFKVSAILSAKNAWITCGVIVAVSFVFAIPMAIEYSPMKNQLAAINDSCNAYLLCR